MVSTETLLLKHYYRRQGLKQGLSLSLSLPPSLDLSIPQQLTAAISSKMLCHFSYICSNMDVSRPISMPLEHATHCRMWIVGVPRPGCSINSESFKCHFSGAKFYTAPPPTPENTLPGVGGGYERGGGV